MSETAEPKSSYEIKFGKRPLYVLLGAVVGIALGAIAGESISFLEPFGLIFIRLLKFIVGPLILVSIAHALTTMNDFKRLGKVFGYFMAYWAGAGIIAAVIGFITATIMKPGVGVQLAEKATPVAGTTLKAIIVSFFPTNSVQPFLEMQLVQVIVIAILVGIAIAILGGTKEHKKSADFLRELLSSSLVLIYKIVDMILWYAPIGVFCLMANLIGTTGIDALQSVAKMVLTQWVAYIIILLVLHPLIMLVILKVTPFTFWKKMAPAMITGFAIQSSSGTLPITLGCTKKLGVPEDTADVILPLAATINMQAVAAEMPIYALWVAQMYQLELPFLSIVVAIILGVFGAAACAGVPGGGILIATITLTTLGLPLTAVGWIAGIYIFIDVLNTMTNVTCDPLGVMCVSKWMKEFNKEEFYAKKV